MAVVRICPAHGGYASEGFRGCPYCKEKSNMPRHTTLVKTAHRIDLEHPQFCNGCPRVDDASKPLREAIGLMTTIKPTMEMRADDPVGMAQEVVAEVERLREDVKYWQARLKDMESRWHASLEQAEKPQDTKGDIDGNNR